MDRIDRTKLIILIVILINNLSSKAQIKRDTAIVVNFNTEVNIKYDSIVFFKHIRGNYYASYYDNGKVQSFGKRSPKKRHYGVWKHYYYSGVLKESGKYYNSKKIGMWYYYNEQGTLINKIKH
jgi:antitoxin component YwqK of YwqJK toxin-antitoxin module